MARIKLPKKFYTRRDTIRIARELLGTLLVVPAGQKRVSGIIVETEAYLGPEDKASHARGNRRTKRTETMFGAGGHAYVYFVYGMHFQFNIVVSVKDTPHAILVRAVEPHEGIDLMENRRKQTFGKNLTNGPGKLCQALGIDLELNQEDLLGTKVWIETALSRLAPNAISSGPRVGIDYSEEFILKPWRFWITDNPFVSKTPARKTALPVTIGK